MLIKNVKTFNLENAILGMRFPMQSEKLSDSYLSPTSSFVLGEKDQAIHHTMLEEGLENFMFELLEDCEKDQLVEREKYYIKLFQSQEHGYNRNVGD